MHVFFYIIDFHRDADTLQHFQAAFFRSSRQRTAAKNCHRRSSLVFQSDLVNYGTCAIQCLLHHSWNIIEIQFSSTQPCCESVKHSHGGSEAFRLGAHQLQPCAGVQYHMSAGCAGIVWLSGNKDGLCPFFFASFYALDRSNTARSL